MNCGFLVLVAVLRIENFAHSFCFLHCFRLAYLPTVGCFWWAVAWAERKQSVRCAVVIIRQSWRKWIADGQRCTNGCKRKGAMKDYGISLAISSVLELKGDQMIGGYGVWLSLSFVGKWSYIP